MYDEPCSVEECKESPEREKARMLDNTVSSVWYKLKESVSEDKYTDTYVGYIKKLWSFDTASDMLKWLYEVEAKIKTKKLDKLDNEDEEEGMEFILLSISSDEQKQLTEAELGTWGDK